MISAATLRFRRSRRHRLLAAGLALAAQAASAHDFWLQPDRFVVAPDSIAGFTLQVGHGADRQRSVIPARRIVRIAVIGPRGEAVDLRPRLDLGGAAFDGSFQPREPGSYVLLLESDDRAQSHLPAERFNTYLAEEGLTPAIEQRRLAGRMTADGAESYGRRTKAIVRVGAADRRSPPSPHVTRPLGMTLEIVPDIDPSAIAGPGPLPVRVFYQGRPLAGALVKLTQLTNDAEPIAARRTDATGRARFDIPSAGAWLTSVVWTRPLPGQPTDFETIFSSLSFAIGDR